MTPALAQWDPSAVGRAPQRAARLGLSCSGSCPSWGRKGSASTPSLPAPRSWEGRGGWGTPQHSSPCFFGTLGWRGGIRVGEGGPWPISTLPANLSLLFSAPPYKIPLQLHPQHRRWPGSTRTRSCPTDWSLDPVPPPEPLNPGPGGSPGKGGCGCTCHPAPPSARVSLAPNPPATPSLHIFRVRLPQKTPNPHAGDAGRPGSPCPAGSRFARERCPVHAVSQAGPAPGLRAAWCACLSPSQAEPSRARGAGRMLQCRRVRQAPIYGQAVWWPQGRPALPPPLAVMQARAGASAEAKGQAREPANVSLLLI